MTRAIADEDAFLLADVRRFPVVEFFLVNAQWFAEHDTAGRLPTSGWPPDRVLAEIEADYTLVRRNVPAN